MSRETFRIAIGLLLTAWILLQLGCKRKPAEAQPEVGLGDLTLRDGRLCPRGSTNPFTGRMVEIYPGGGLKSRTDLSNGWIHGLSLGWYTNGQMQIREPFSNGISHGLRVKWYENGQKQSEAPIRLGKLEGTFRRWDDQGRLMEELEMKGGDPDGVSHAYYPDGSIKVRAVMAKGKVLERKSWKPGEFREKNNGTHSSN